MNEEPGAGGLITWKSFIIPMIIMIFIGMNISLNLFPVCDGGPKYFSRTGVLKDVYVANDLCCHCYAEIWFYNQSSIRTVDCNDDLMNIPLNHTYTFYFKPDAESYAVNIGCFWDNIVDYVENENGKIVYGY